MVRVVVKFPVGSVVKLKMNTSKAKGTVKNLVQGSRGLVYGVQFDPTTPQMIVGYEEHELELDPVFKAQKDFNKDLKETIE